MTRTEIRNALLEVRESVAVPPVDRLAFRARVRAERRRRTTGRLAVAGIAAAAVAVVGTLTLGAGGGLDRVRDEAPAGPTTSSGRVFETVWFVRDGQLTALAPDGSVHPMDLRTEGVVGWTSERVYALDEERRLVVRTVSYDDEGARTPTFGAEQAPVSGVLQSAALSGDGRYLGWVDLEGTAHRYDLKADRVDFELVLPEGAGLVDVGADGLLSYDAGRLELRAGRVVIEVPTRDDGTGAAAQLAMGHVLVPGRDGRTRLYAVSSGRAEEVTTLDGFGVLGPYAERVATWSLDGGGAGLEVWDGELGAVTGLTGTPDDARWADEQTLLVTTRSASGQQLSVCGLDLDCAPLPVEGEVNLGG